MPRRFCPLSSPTQVCPEVALARDIMMGTVAHSCPQARISSRVSHCSDSDVYAFLFTLPGEGGQRHPMQGSDTDLCLSPPSPREHSVTFGSLSAKRTSIRRVLPMVAQSHPQARLSSRACHCSDSDVSLCFRFHMEGGSGRRWHQHCVEFGLIDLRLSPPTPRVARVAKWCTCASGWRARGPSFRDIKKKGAWAWATLLSVVRGPGPDLLRSTSPTIIIIDPRATFMDLVW